MELKNRKDGCVDEPENFNGVLDHGMVVLKLLDLILNSLIDSDYDSIPDSKDDCPYERENFNKFEDG